MNDPAAQPAAVPDATRTEDPAREAATPAPSRLEAAHAPGEKPIPALSAIPQFPTTAPGTKPEEEMLPGAKPFVVEIHTYANEKGHRIEERRLVSGELPGRYPAFLGHAIFIMEDSQGNKEQTPISFPIIAPDVATAFLKYTRMRDVTKERIVAERNAPVVDNSPRIQLPGAPTGPGGVPIRGP